jgi:hypothetical protein
MPERDEVIDPLLLAASRAGHRLFRNNQGIGRTPDGNVVKFGVGLGGSDLIGWTRLVVTPSMVGHEIAVFTAIECKTGKQRPTKQQEAFLATVQEAGGIGFWGNDPDAILRAWIDEDVMRRARGE